MSVREWAHRNRMPLYIVDAARDNVLALLDADTLPGHGIIEKGDLLEKAVFDLAMVHWRGEPNDVETVMPAKKKTTKKAVPKKKKPAKKPVTQATAEHLKRIIGG